MVPNRSEGNLWMDIDWRGGISMSEWQSCVKDEGYRLISNRATWFIVVDGGSVEDEKISTDKGDM